MGISLKESIFVSCFMVILIFNFIYLSVTGEVYTMLIGAITGMCATVISVAIISGFNILGSGLIGESIKILFATGSLLNILFQVYIFGYPLGLGLINNMVDIFPSNIMSGVGFFIMSMLATLTFISGLLIVIGD